MSLVTRAEERRARETRDTLIERLAAKNDTARSHNTAEAVETGEAVKTGATARSEPSLGAHDGATVHPTATGWNGAAAESPVQGEASVHGRASVHGPAPATNEVPANGEAVTRLFTPDSDTGEAAPPRRSSRRFAIDAGRLADYGIMGPKVIPRRLRSEIRTVKHRLTNRMNFFDRRERIGNRQENTILLTSVQPGEGKSFMAANLAMSFASESRVNTLLVDADALTSTIPTIFGIDDSRGLTDYLRGRESDLSGLLQRADSMPLTLLPRGAVDVAASELFGSQRMADFVSELKARYRDRVIIFDTPALLASNDALVLAKYVDEVVVVVGADSTPRHVTESALELFDTHDNVSLVLNKCPLATDTHVGDEIGALGRAGEAASS